MGYVNKRKFTASSRGISWSESKEGAWGCWVNCVCEGKGSNFQNTFPVFSSVPFFPSSLFPQCCWTCGPSDTSVLFYPRLFPHSQFHGSNLYSLRVCFTVEVPSMPKTHKILNLFNYFVLSCLLPVSENSNKISSMHGEWGTWTPPKKQPQIFTWF